jgi:hypothetical protein
MLYTSIELNNFCLVYSFNAIYTLPGCVSKNFSIVVVADDTIVLIGKRVDFNEQYYVFGQMGNQVRKILYADVKFKTLLHYLYAIAAVDGPAKGMKVVDLKPTAFAHLSKSAVV